MVQGLPLRVYVGLSEQTEPDNDRITLAGCKYFVPSEYFSLSEAEGTSGESPFRFRNQLESYEKALSALAQIGKKQLGPWQYGLKVHLLCELPPHCGLNVEGAFSVALATSFLLATESLDAEDVSATKCRSLDGTFPVDSGPEKVFQLASKLELAIMDGRASGAGLISAVVPGRYPMLYVLPQPAKEEWLGENNSRPVPVTEQPNRDYIAHPLVGSEADLPPWPVDFGLVWSGRPSRLASDSRRLGEVLGQTVPDAIGYMASEVIPKLGKSSEESDLLSDVAARPRRFGQDAYRNILTEVSAECIFAFQHLLTDGANDSWKKLLFEAMNCQQRILFMLNLSSLHFDLSADTFRKIINEFPGTEDAGIKLSGSAGGGDLLFAVGTALLSDSDIAHIFDNLPEIPRRRPCLDYASWVDGMDSQGLVMDVSPRGVVAEAIILQKDGICIRRYLHSLNEKEAIAEEADVFFDDMVGSRPEVRVRGQFLSSTRRHVASVGGLVRGGKQLLLAAL